MMKSTAGYCVRIFYMMIDVCLGYASLFAACLLRARTLPFSVTWQCVLFDARNPYRWIFILWLLIAVVVARIYGLYYTDRTRSIWAELWRVLQSNAATVVAVIVIGYALKIHGLPRMVVFLTFIFMTVSFCLWRVAKRSLVDYLVIHGYNNRNTLIIGAGKVGSVLKDEIEEHRSMGWRIVGFLDDFPERVADENRPLVLGKIADFKMIAQRYFVESIFITIHHNEDVFLRLISQARDLGVSVHVVPSGYDLITGECAKRSIGFIPILEYVEPGKGLHHFGKRFFDITVSLLGCLVLSPVFIIAAVCIKLDSRGPVFYLSERFGKNAKRFKMIKFRTMVKGADQKQQALRDQSEVDGPIFKMRHDPRVTRMGRFLRKYSLDELPQLINVLKGDMSLVGPRPFPVDQIEREDLRQFRRMGVRPGITGLWQIKGRSDVSFRRLLRWDIWYIKNWSFLLDMSILWNTIPAVIKGRGAY